MRKLRLMRRLANGMPCMLLAALLLFARLVGPAMATPSTDPAGLLALQAICHTDAPGQPGEPVQSDHSDCLLCPACHLVSHAAFPTPAVPAVPPPPVVAIDVGEALPPATGPPSRIRTAAQPTGPPTLSA